MCFFIFVRVTTSTHPQSLYKHEMAVAQGNGNMANWNAKMYTGHLPVAILDKSANALELLQSYTELSICGYIAHASLSDEDFIQFSKLNYT